MHHRNFLTNVGHGHLVSLFVQSQSVDKDTRKVNNRKMQHQQFSIVIQVLIVSSNTTKTWILFVAKSRSIFWHKVQSSDE
jgi:hypothetical protein